MHCVFHAGLQRTALLLLLLLLSATTWQSASAYEPRTYKELPRERCSVDGHDIIGIDEAQAQADKECTVR